MKIGQPKLSERKSQRKEGFLTDSKSEIDKEGLVLFLNLNLDGCPDAVACGSNQSL
jgi:hypothetical protein